MTAPAVLRLVDASANRALEGVRVCEEIVRLSLSSARLFRQLRALRHGIAGAIRRLPVGPGALAGARDSRGDVGRRAAASRVGSLQQLLIINLQRTKEALRTLEECARVLAPRKSAEFQRLRFRAYDIERAILLKLAALRDR